MKSSFTMLKLGTLSDLIGRLLSQLGKVFTGFMRSILIF